MDTPRKMIFKAGLIPILKFSYATSGRCNLYNCPRFPYCMILAIQCTRNVVVHAYSSGWLAHVWFRNRNTAIMHPCVPNSFIECSLCGYNRAYICWPNPHPVSPKTADVITPSYATAAMPCTTTYLNPYACKAQCRSLESLSYILPIRRATKVQQPKNINQYKTYHIWCQRHVICEKELTDNTRLVGKMYCQAEMVACSVNCSLWSAVRFKKVRNFGGFSASGNDQNILWRRICSKTRYILLYRSASVTANAAHAYMRSARSYCNYIRPRACVSTDVAMRLTLTTRFACRLYLVHCGLQLSEYAPSNARTYVHSTQRRRRWPDRCP